MMSYSEWFAWLSQKWEIELRDRISELRGRTGRAQAWTTLHNHAIREGKVFRLHLVPTVGKHLHKVQS